MMDLIHRNPVAMGVIIAMSLLCVAIVIGVLLGFAAPPVVLDPTEPATVGSQAAQANSINWNTIILAFFSLLTTIATTAGGIYLVKIKMGQDASGKQLTSLSKVTNDTHTLVNSNMGIQLRLNTVALKRIAELTNDPKDVVAAELADTAYQEHLKKQALVDAEKKKGQ
jgi:hypothetical protein